MKFKQLTDEIIFPPSCYLCSRLLARQGKSHLRYICPQCLSALPFCPDSNLLLPADQPVLSEGQHSRWNHKPMPVQAVFFYEGVIREIILRLKFSGHTEYSRLLGSLLGSVMRYRFKKFNLWPAGIIPMPLSNARLMQRGYNQADLLAKYLSEEIGVEVFPMARRIKETKRQSEMSTREERQSNVHGAFELDPDFPVNRFHGKQLILLDDVLTSGSTIQACAKPLQQAGLNLLGLVAAAANK